MKKISMFFVATAMVAFVACSGGEKKSEDAAIVAEETVVVEEVAPSSTSSDFIAQYQSLCDKIIELAPKLKNQDADALQEYQKIAEEFAGYAMENQETMNNLSDADKAIIQELDQKVAEAMQ